MVSGGSKDIGTIPLAASTSGEARIDGAPRERPLAIDLYTGLHGWAEGLIAAGWRVIGFDLHDMSRLLGEPLPEDHFQLVIQDVLTLHGSQFKDAQLIVGSSPCQEFSYRAMPWKRAKALGPPELGMALFHAQFRIQREASEAAGRHIPLVVENVRGAQPWVGRARANFGSYYLWGDVPALMPIVTPRKVAGFRFDGNGGSFQSAAVAEHVKNPGRSLEPGAPRFNDRIANFPAEHQKNTGGSWFNIGSPGQTQTNNNPARGAAVAEARKGAGAGAGAGAAWFDANLCQLPSGSSRRKAASAKIAKIPFTLAHWIGSVWLPSEWRASSRQDHTANGNGLTTSEAA